MAHKGWVFTLNNPTLEEEDKLKEYLTFNCEWGAFGHEEGENGTPHLQGAFVLKRQRVLLSIKRHMPRAHLEPMRGTPYESREYALKDNEGIWSIGELRRPGCRTDLQEMKRAWYEGEKESVIVDKYCNNTQQFQFLEHLKRAKPRRREIVEKNVTWIYGPSGSGKTTKAYEIALELAEGNEDTIWWRHAEAQWMQGYTDHEVAILDDIEEDTYKLLHLLKLTDKFPYSVGVKGTSAIWQPKHIIITSLEHPEYLFNTHSPAKIVQLTRRIKRIIQMQERDVAEPEILFIGI